jgi:hypothetical protein
MKDMYWTDLVASPEQQRRGLALADAISHCRRAAAAIAAAAEGEAHPYRGPALLEVHEQLRGLEKALRMLS